MKMKRGEFSVLCCQDIWLNLKGQIGFENRKKTFSFVNYKMVNGFIGTGILSYTFE